MKKALMTTCMAVALAGCATSAAENDPAQGGFGNAVSGVLGGQYEERLQQREAEADQLAMRNADLEARSSALKAQRDQLSVEISKARKRIADQNARISSFAQQLAQSSSATVEQKEKLSRLSSRAKDLRERADRMDAYSTTKSASGVGDELAELEKDSDALSSEFDLLASGLR